MSSIELEEIEKFDARAIAQNHGLYRTAPVSAKTISLGFQSTSEQITEHEAIAVANYLSGAFREAGIDCTVGVRESANLVREYFVNNRGNLQNDLWSLKQRMSQCAWQNLGSPVSYTLTIKPAFRIGKGRVPSMQSNKVQKILKNLGIAE